MRVELHHDAAAFLRRAGDHLGLDPVLSTVVATFAQRTAREVAAGVQVPAEDWWAVVLDDDPDAADADADADHADHGAVAGGPGHVVGVAMRTAPFAPRPAYLLPMPDAAAVALARRLHERGEHLPAANGALPAARVVLEETCRLVGGRVETGQQTRLFALDALVEPRPVPGRLRPATPAEVDLVQRWHAAFGAAADEQAGRPRGASYHEAPSTADLARRIVQGREWLWEDPDGEVVHLTSVNAPAFGVARIGPVYTPPEHRGRGLASAAVAAASRRLLADGVRPCLFTDQANPTSNHVYTALGYRPVVDMANLVRR